MSRGSECLPQFTEADSLYQKLPFYFHEDVVPSRKLQFLHFVSVPQVSPVLLKLVDALLNSA